MRASDTSEVVLTDCRSPATALLGQVGEGFKQAMGILDGGRISIAALAVGTAAGAYGHALSTPASESSLVSRSAHFKRFLHACRHGDGDRRRATADSTCGLDEGQRLEDDTRIVDGKASMRAR
ncbi:MAG: hypothetical protein U0V87_10425 [Acidobacteriota bacterium]